MPETRREPLTRSGWPLCGVRESAPVCLCVYIFLGESPLSLSLFCPLSPINRPADKIIMLQFSNLFSAFNFSLVSASSIKRAHYQKLSAKSSQELHHPFGLWEKRRVWPQDIAAATAETSSTTWSQLIICSLKLSESDSICQTLIFLYIADMIPEAFYNQTSKCIKQKERKKTLQCEI